MVPFRGEQDKNDNGKRLWNFLLIMDFRWITLQIQKDKSNNLSPKEEHQRVLLTILFTVRKL